MIVQLNLIYTLSPLSPTAYMMFCPWTLPQWGGSQEPHQHELASMLVEASQPSIAGFHQSHRNTYSNLLENPCMDCNTRARN